eukprot:912562-Prorocentrum_minimum.AAC.2
MINDFMITCFTNLDLHDSACTLPLAVSARGILRQPRGPLPRVTESTLRRDARALASCPWVAPRRRSVVRRGGMDGRAKPPEVDLHYLRRAAPRPEPTFGHAAVAVRGQAAGQGEGGRAQWSVAVVRCGPVRLADVARWRREEIVDGDAGGRDLLAIDVPAF